MEGVGATATMTAAARARETERTDHLFDDPWAAALAGEDGFAFLNAQDAASGLVEPNPAFVVRHRFFDDFVWERAVTGIHQVVLVAAGLDTRAYRLPWPGGVTLFEIDQPSVLTYKRAVLEQADASPKCVLRSVAVDLRDDWTPQLLREGYDPQQPSMWIAEGLLYYLPAQAVHGLLESAATLACPGSVLGTDTMSATFLSDPSREAWLKFYEEAGAALTFGVNDPARLLEEHGWEPMLHGYPEIARALGRRWPSPPEQGAVNAVITGLRPTS